MSGPEGTPQPGTRFASVLGLDIGGANLKAAWYGPGSPPLSARSQPFALWKDPAGLAGALQDLVRSFPPADALAVTMTGELCDCFDSKRQGVHAILDAVERAVGGAKQRATGPVIRVWRNDGRFVDREEAGRTALQVAAANWLALATFAARYVPAAGPALVLDIGSTTADIIPLLDGLPVPRGRTDPERLACHELVYTGVRRTPLAALLDGQGAAELFATTLDAYLVLGLIPEDAADRNTADGRPATQAAAQARLARMLCADLETSTEEQRRRLAERVLQRQVGMLGKAMHEVTARMPGLPRTVVLAGEGAFLADRVLTACGFLGPSALERIWLDRVLSPDVARAACAHAVAVLAAEPNGRSGFPSPPYHLTVVKVGGSLFDLPDLGPRLRRWLSKVSADRIVLVPGGGRTADVVRNLDRRHALGEESAHWLALRALALHAHFLARLLPEAAVCETVAGSGRLAILDVHAFSRADEGQPGCLPHSWAATSDAVAARAAVRAGARSLVLLKSVTIPEGRDWAEAARRGLVDPAFVEVIRSHPALEVRTVNFRDEALG